MTVALLPSTRRAIGFRWSRKEREVEVHILWGKPGTGKSRAFTNMYDYPFKGIKFKRDGTIWFDGYREESHSYRRNGSVRFLTSELLQICDRYPYQIEVKGAHCMRGPQYALGKQP